MVCLEFGKPSREASVLFAKYQGAGNDFILLDDRAIQFPSHTVERLCHRKYGIGADGLILLQPSSCADFTMRYFNADGGEAALCGNGLRCLMHFLLGLGYNKGKYTIESQGKVYQCAHREEQIVVSLGKGRMCEKDLTLVAEGEKFTVDFVHSGVPHAVIFLPDIWERDLLKMGRAIRFHPFFQPEGVNVNLACPTSKGIEMRTYERGVEAETLACGTGAAAVVFADKRRQGISGAYTMQVLPASGESLEIQIDAEEELLLIGPATFVFSGEIAL